jgi:hypothetical protein
MMKPRSKGRKHWLSEEGEFRIEKGVFLLRLESVPTVCFVGVTAISNRIQLRLEIGFDRRPERSAASQVHRNVSLQ